MTEQWLVLRDALRNLATVICQEPGPVKWLITLSRGILDILERMRMRIALTLCQHLRHHFGNAYDLIPGRPWTARKCRRCGFVWHDAPYMEVAAYQMQQSITTGMKAMAEALSQVAKQITNTLQGIK